MVSEPRSCAMAEGTRHAQLAEAVSILKGEYVHLQEEEKDKQKHMLGAVLQQLNNLAASYEQLVVQANNPQMGESTQDFSIGRIRGEEEKEAETSEGKLAIIQSEESEKEEKVLRELLGISLHAMAARRSKLPVGESHMTIKVANGDSLPC
ncbi:hypothetical protein Patl1_06479 [Pistacia atlantica]|uniref:Uncharacterized protein n=1 Tax=Pistacia atlantica TaxID=434234 RepID=A0ACC1BP48_9ROSI|nr:hypothetical protein Patl1_06479 [Pistacia atlantica]